MVVRQLQQPETPEAPAAPEARVLPAARRPLFVGVELRITEAQRAELRRKAVERQIERGHGQVDVSEIAREALQFWMDAPEES